MRMAIGSDHAGFELREAVKTFLAAEHHEVIDVGTHNQDPVDYPDYAQAVGAAVRESRAEGGDPSRGGHRADPRRAAGRRGPSPCHAEPRHRGGDPEPPALSTSRPSRRDAGDTR
jgi:hypothetical protein